MSQPIQEYTGIPQVDKVLAEAETAIAESVGRYQAQRMIGLFTDLFPVRNLGDKPERRNIWLEVAEAGAKAAMELPLEHLPKECTSCNRTVECYTTETPKDECRKSGVYQA